MEDARAELDEVLAPDRVSLAATSDGALLGWIGAHPFAFYRRLGFAVVGVIPDANGPGRPDILMARRLSPRHAP